MTEPSASSTAFEVKFSDGMRQSEVRCRLFSCSMISQRSGSVSLSGALSIARSALPVLARDGMVDMTRAGVVERDAARRDVASRARDDASMWRVCRRAFAQFAVQSSGRR